MRGRWAPPPAEGGGSGEGQGKVARGRWAPPAAGSTTSGRHATPPAPPPQKFMYLNFGLQFRASLVDFIFPQRNIFLMWVSKGVEGGGGRPLGRAPNDPPPLRQQWSGSKITRANEGNTVH